MPPGPSRVPSGPRRARAGMASGSDRGSGGVNSDPSAHPWTAPEATRPERLLSTSARPPRPACPSPLRLGQAIDPIEQEPGMPTSKIDRMPLLLVALVLAAAAVPGREIGRASCRERVGQYVSSSVVAGSLKKKKKTHTQ